MSTVKTRLLWAAAYVFGFGFLLSATLVTRYGWPFTTVPPEAMLCVMLVVGFAFIGWLNIRRGLQ